MPLVVSDGDLCERCRSVFATLDLSRDVCRLLGSGELPPEVTRAVAVAQEMATRSSPAQTSSAAHSGRSRRLRRANPSPKK